MGGSESTCTSGTDGDLTESSGTIYSSGIYDSSESCQWNLPSPPKNDELLIFRIAENNVDCNEANFLILGNQFCGRANEKCATYSSNDCQSIQINAICHKLVGEQLDGLNVILTGKTNGVNEGGFNMTYEYSKCYRETTTKLPISITDLPTTQVANGTSSAQITSTTESFFANDSEPATFSETLPTSDLATSVFSTSTDKNNEDELNGAIIGAIIVGAILLISLICILLFFAIRRRRKKTNEANGSVYEMATDSSGNSTAIKQVHYSLPPDADNFTVAREFVAKHATVKPIQNLTSVYEDPNIDSNEIYCEIDVKDKPESDEPYELPIIVPNSKNEISEERNNTSKDNAETEVQYTNLIQPSSIENDSDSDSNETKSNSDPHSDEDEGGKMVDNVLYIHKVQSNA